MGSRNPNFGFKATGGFLGLDDFAPTPMRGLVALNRTDVCVQVEVPEGATATGAELRRPPRTLQDDAAPAPVQASGRRARRGRSAP